MKTTPTYLGTAGWSLPSSTQPLFPDGASHLARYSTRFVAAEINSSFHRPHRASTYERWAASVPSSFRFSVKIPKTITHAKGLVSATGELDTFLAEISGLGERLGCLLARVAMAADPGGWPEVVYHRLHGSPRTYYSSYDAAYLRGLADHLIEARREVKRIWCIFDNTASGAATANALELDEMLQRVACPHPRTL